MQAKGLWRACYGPFIADHLPGTSKPVAVACCGTAGETGSFENDNLTMPHINSHLKDFTRWLYGKI